jgi:putative glutamine amidotransferase
MPARPPLVAVPTYRIPREDIRGWTADAYAVPRTYVEALRRAGAWPVLLPGPDPGPPDEVLAPFAGLLLAGGGDLEPRRYGGEYHPEVYGTDPDRDEIELELLGAARRRGVPVLAICRGFQLVNVATGGTIRQHLPDEDLPVRHGQPMVGTSTFHPVRVEAGSCLAEVVGGDVAERCLSHHHQGVGRVGDGLRAVGWTDDGLIEAVEPEDPGSGWLLAVQWHPEMTAADDPQQQALFDAFAREVRR